MATMFGDHKEARVGEMSSGEESNLSVGEELPETMTFPEGGSRAWCVVIGCAGVMFCTLGHVNAFGVYQEYYETHQLQDHSPSDISWIGSLQIFFQFAGGLVGGPLFDRYGAKVIWPAAAVYIFCIMMTSICESYYQFMLAQGVLAGLALGMTMSPCMAATAQYFNKNRGAAIGCAIAGSSLGGVVFPIALGKMLYNPQLGFGWTIRIIGFVMLIVLAISCSGIRARLPPRKDQFFLPSAFKEPTYLASLSAGFLMLLGFFVPFFYLPVYAVEHGMDKELASYLLAILNAASFFGRVIPGILADKIGRYNMFWAAGICTGILIFCWPQISTSAEIIAFAALYGFFSGAIISSMALCLLSCTDNPKNMGTYMGMGMFVVSIAALIGPPVNGALVAHYGGFEQLSILSGTLVLTGSFSILLAKLASGQKILAKS
ncbi:hypothetical protein MMC11_008208 [Xylographa trunciseda]|nr:hypothetical protein [Xylographa trunciseda]